MLDTFATLLVLTALLSWINQRLLRLPTTIGVMVASLVSSLALVGLDALGLAGSLREREAALLRSLDFSALLMQGMLSLLLFAGALHVDVAALHARRWQVGLLACFATALSTALIGGLLFVALPPLGLALPLLPCLLFGALISPTDPIAVLGMLKSAGAPRDLEVVIAGESLFNDGVGVVIFSLLVDLAIDGAAPSAGRAAWLLLREAGGGLLFGWLLGQGMARLLRGVEQTEVAALLTLAGVVGGYALAGHLHVSGPLAMVAAGLVVGSSGRPSGVAEATSPRAGCAAGDSPCIPSADEATAWPHRRLHEFWALLDEMLNAVLFVLVGMQVIVIRFPVGAWAAVASGVVAIVVTLTARWVTVGLPVRAFPALFGLRHGAAGALTWGGLRGGLSLALALGIAPGPWRETLVALTYCVVAFSILVQGLTFPRLARALLATGGRS